MEMSCMAGCQQRVWGDGARFSDPRTWDPSVHIGHRLWAAMSDAFWVFVYKVRRCRQVSSHDWTTCPYAHKGERARRRDPRSFSYLAMTCPEYLASKQTQQQARTGAAPTCVRGLRCRYAHGVFEYWLHPTRFRTVMCEAGLRCRRRVCFFAHSPAELRGANDPVPLVGMPPPPPPLYAPRAPAPSFPRRVDRILQATPGRNNLRLLHNGDGASSSSSPSPAAAVAVATAAAPVPALPQASPDGEDAGGKKSGGGASDDEDGSVAGDYPHFDLISDMVNWYRRLTASSGGAHPSDPTTWYAWAHRGHRLWALMPDAFWVYVYKVHPCPTLSSHDWTTCPYAHEGERAARRDPRSFAYLAMACAEYRKSQQHHHNARTGEAATCARGLRCRYAHGVFETWLHPAKFRTVTCEAGAWCRRQVCFFAHFPAELRRENDPVLLAALPPPPARATPAPAPLSSPRRVDSVVLHPMPGKLDDHDAGASSSSPSPAAAVAVAMADDEDAGDRIDDFFALLGFLKKTITKIRPRFKKW
ncbi:Zinc finger CCCH domain-containing protein 54 [Dichanthelium oligosanthes]|uniref:Zinc finger CCCH domain-containing protein 54 n=1 Tax=Dichanthelium oligosanthes TaxID=888268 RepID=A0A1E5VXR8_9POAL|nr:Zinc finger CCCH domain-containing protein 54 [Dichanthelium oligosanthes]